MHRFGVVWIGRRSARVGYLRAWGLHAYINLEQVYDLHANQAGSQFGLSFSSK